MIRVHRAEPGKFSDRPKGVRPPVAKTLPSFIRDKLVAASLAPRSIRAVEVDRAIAWARTHYPQFFKQEELEV